MARTLNGPRCQCNPTPEKAADSHGGSKFINYEFATIRQAGEDDEYFPISTHPLASQLGKPVEEMRLAILNRSDAAFPDTVVKIKLTAGQWTAIRGMIYFRHQLTDEAMIDAMQPELATQKIYCPHRTCYKT